MYKTGSDTQDWME